MKRRNDNRKKMKRKNKKDNKENKISKTNKHSRINLQRKRQQKTG